MTRRLLVATVLVLAACTPQGDRVALAPAAPVEPAAPSPTPSPGGCEESEVFDYGPPEEADPATTPATAAAAVAQYVAGRATTGEDEYALAALTPVGAPESATVWRAERDGVLLAEVVLIPHGPGYVVSTTSLRLPEERCRDRPAPVVVELEEIEGAFTEGFDLTVTVVDAAGDRQEWRWADVVHAAPGPPDDLDRWYDTRLPFTVAPGPAQLTLDLQIGMEPPRRPCVLDLELAAGAETVVTALFSPDVTSGACAWVGPGAFPAEGWARDVAAADPRLQEWLAGNGGAFRVAWVDEEDVVVRYDLVQPVPPEDYPLDRCNVGRPAGSVVTGVQWLLDRADRSISAVAPVHSTGPIC